MGKEAPETENCPADMEVLTIATLRLVEFVTDTACEALVEPTAWLPKLMEDGLTFGPACAAVENTHKTVTAAAV